MEIDWSSGHAKFADDALHAGHMNVGIGGAQSKLKDSTIINGCLGDNPAIHPTTKEDLKLQLGQVQKMCFQEGDAPPFFNTKLKKEDYIGQAKGLKQVLWERGLYKDQIEVEVVDKVTKVRRVRV